MVGRTYCLPPQLATEFANKLGSLSKDDLNKLKGLSSLERQTIFDQVVGEAHSPDVNALFEQKMLLKGQQAGLARWQRQLSNVTPAIRNDLTNKINNMDRILDDKTEGNFLQDLARTKLGAVVTAEEAQQIINVASRVMDLKRDMQRAITAGETPADRPGRQDAFTAYGKGVQELHDTIESMKPDGSTLVHKIIDAANLPKSLETGILHFSAIGVQAWGMISDARTWQAAGEMFKYFGNEENYQNLKAWIISHPDYDLARRAKLGITELGDKLSLREEALQSTYLQKFNDYVSDKTGLPNIVRASSRAFTGFLNYLRFKTFTGLLSSARALGEDVTPGSQATREIAKAINDHTGRGALGVNDAYGNVAPALNIALFSPRKLSAAVEMFDPINLINTGEKNWGTASATARNFRYRQLAGSLAATGLTMAFFRVLGYNVGWNPTAQNFGEIEHNGLRYDITGGSAVYTRLLARIALGQEITSKGKLIDLTSEYTYKPTTRADLVEQFIRNKTGPTAGALWDALAGTDSVGRPFDPEQEARDRMLPIQMSGFIDYMNNNPKDAGDFIPILSSMFGVGVRAPLPPPEREGMNIWGEPTSFANKFVHDQSAESQELQGLGYNPGFPSPTINGVKLNTSQYKQYINMSGMFQKELVHQAITSSKWQDLSKNQKIIQVKQDRDLARTKAQTIIIMQSHGTDNDILAKSLQNEQEKLKANQ